MRCDTIIKCLKTIEALQKPGGRTAAELAEILGIHTRTAYRYIDALSITGCVVTHDQQPSRFELLDTKKFLSTLTPGSTSSQEALHDH